MLFKKLLITITNCMVLVIVPTFFFKNTKQNLFIYQLISNNILLFLFEKSSSDPNISISFVLFYITYINYNLINLIDIIICGLTKKPTQKKNRFIIWNNVLYNIKYLFKKLNYLDKKKT